MALDPARPPVTFLGPILGLGILGSSKGGASRYGAVHCGRPAISPVVAVVPPSKSFGSTSSNSKHHTKS